MAEQLDEQDRRIEEIIGNEDENLSRYDAVVKFYEHLERRLQFPFDVTGY